MRPFDLLQNRRVKPIELACFDSLDKGSPVEYRQLAVLLVSRWQRTGSKVIGIGGGQGSGKTTLCSLVQEVARNLGESVAILSLDDFYLTKAKRLSLAESVHDSLRTRGPPGTHEIELLIETIRDLSRGRASTVPVFDKGLDDRIGVRAIGAGTSRIVVEGWCVGARPEPTNRLVEPVNSMESERDPDGVCRMWINERLAGPYKKLTGLFDELVYIRVPNIESVRLWRLQQEMERPASLRMDKAAVDRFVEHYERVTVWMMEDLSDKADVMVALDDSHEVVNLCGLD